MSTLYRKPEFGGKLKTDAYYAAIGQLVSDLRSTQTLRAISEALNTAGWRTPTNLPWTRDRLATYLKTNEVKTTEKEST